MTVCEVKLGGSILPVKEFKMSMMCENPSIVMVAKRGSGKSWLCRSILQHFRDIPVGIVIAPTERLAVPPFYADFIPDSYIHYEYKSELIEKILARQIEMNKKNDKKREENKHLDERLFILMDDCLGDVNTWKRDPPIKELLFNGRHYKIMYLLTMQFPLGIGPELRTNFDYIFLLADSNYNNLKKLYIHYAGMFPTMDSFLTVHKELTKNYGAMVLVCRDAGPLITDQIFWYKADNTDNGYIGCKQYIDHHKHNYDDQWKYKKTQIIDIMNMKKRK